MRTESRSHEKRSAPKLSQPALQPVAPGADSHNPNPQEMEQKVKDVQRVPSEDCSDRKMMAACVDAMPGAIVSFRFDYNEGKGSFPYASANCKDIFGYGPEEPAVDLATLRARIHPDDVERIDAAIAASAAQMTRYHEEYRYLHPLKGTVWLEVQSTPTREAEGTIIWHGYVCDVTARKRAEEELRLSEARHRAFFDANLTGVCYGDAVTAVITEANQKFLEMLGFTREDLSAGRINWKELTPPEYRAANEAAIEELLTTGRNERPTEKEYFRKDGSRLPVLVSRALLDQEKLEGVAFVLDISEQKQNEAREREAHRDRVAVMRSMALGIAHEINQPLAATAIYLKALPRLLDMRPDERPSSIQETVNKATSQILRAGEIISRLRSFIAHGEPDKIKLRLHDLIMDAIHATMAGAIENKVSISLAMNAASDLVLADKVQITQVMVNLIRNANEAMESSQQRRLAVSTRSTDLEITVDVVDTGVGLCGKRQSALFVPFATTKASGMGIGLSISREIIEAHQGKIWGEQRPEGGAVFSFTLPLAEEAAD